MNRKALKLAAVFVLSWAFHAKGLRAPLLDYHYHRQCNTAAIARNYHENGLRFFNPQIDWLGAYSGRSATEFPLYMWLTGVFWPAAGLGEVWGRLLSALFSALAAVYLVLFLERRIGEKPAFYAGLLFSCAPLEIYFGRTVQPEATALLSTIAAFYHWDRHLRGSPAHGALAAVFAFLAIAHKLPYMYILGPMAYMAWRQRPQGAARTLAAAALFPLVLAGVAAWYRYAGQGAYVVPARPSEVAGILNYDKLPYYLQFQILSRFPELVTTYGGLALFILGCRALARRPGWDFFAIWFAGVLASLVVGGGYSFHHEYSSLPMVLPAAGVMGLGLAALIESLRAPGKPWKIAGAAVLLASMPVHAFLRINHWYRLNHPELPAAERAADAVSARGDLFICNERASSTILYYLHRKGWSWDLVEMGPQRLGMIEEKMAQGARFYAAMKSGVFAGKDNGFAQYLHSRYPVAWDRDGLLIFKLEPSRPRAPRRPR